MPTTLTPYYNQLGAAQQAAVLHNIQYCRTKGITNQFALAGILCIISKESNFKAVREKSYRNTKIEVIRKNFGDRLTMYTDEQLQVLKKNDYNFFEAVYGYTTAVGKANGNTKPGDGYKYRGAWYNQLTFYNAMKKIGDQIGIPIYQDPDKYLTDDVAARINLQYHYNTFAKIPKRYLQYYKTDGINGFTDLNGAIKCFYNSNAGWGKTPEKLELSTNKGRKLALERGPEFLLIVQKQLAA